MKRNTRRALCFSLALCLCLALFAMTPPRASAETGIKKVLIQTGNGGTPPVVWLELQYFPTKTSTEGCYISSAQWYYADHTPVTGRFKDDTEVYLVVYVDASPGYVFNDDARCYINGSEATYTKISPTSRRVESHKYKPEVWAAAVYKNPTGETVDPGGWASFVVSGGYVQDYQWCIRTPDKRHWYTLDEAKSEATVVEGAHVPKDFLQVTWTGEDTDRLILSNIPADFDALDIIGNGDLLTAEDVIAMEEQTGCDGFMIARGAQGNPWIFRQILHYFETGEHLPKPPASEVAQMILRHARMMLEFKGEYIGIREIRKHAAWYTAGYPHGARLRVAINQVENYEQLETLLMEYFV